MASFRKHETLLGEVTLQHFIEILDRYDEEEAEREEGNLSADEVDEAGETDEVDETDGVDESVE